MGPETTNMDETMCGFPPPGPETIEVEQVLGANYAQRVVEFDMIVPSPKPDMEQIIDVYVKDVEVKTIDVIKDRVIVRGELDVKVMYVANLPDQPVHAFETEAVHWTRDVEIDGTIPGMTASADATVDLINYDFDPATPRQMHITIVLKVWARVTTTTQMDVYPVPPAGEMGVTEGPMAGNLGAGMNPEATPAMQPSGYCPENVMVSGPGITPTAGTSMAPAGTATVTGNRVNVRTGPGTNFPVVAKVNKGDVVTIKDSAFGWYKVVLPDGNTTGWIASWLLDVTGITTTKG